LGEFFDDDRDEETLDSTFYNELFGYNIQGNGRWISLPLKKKKKKGAAGNAAKKKKLAAAAKLAEEQRAAREGSQNPSEDGQQDEMDQDVDSDAEAENGIAEDSAPKPWELAQLEKEQIRIDQEEDDPDDPEKSIPSSRYNAMLAVQKNTLYIYGGILERGDTEFTLDDFFSLQLDKLDKFVCLQECKIDETEWKGSDSEDDSTEEDSDSDSHHENSEEEENSDEEENILANNQVLDDDVTMADLKLSDAEQAAIDAAKAQAEVSFPYWIHSSDRS